MAVEMSLFFLDMYKQVKGWFKGALNGAFEVPWQMGWWFNGCGYHKAVVGRRYPTSATERSEPSQGFQGVNNNVLISSPQWSKNRAEAL